MRLLTAAAAASALLLLPACSSDDQKPAGANPQDVLATAAAKLDATSGVELTVTSAGLPDSGNVLVGGSGVAVHPDSFQGTLKVRVLGMTDGVEILATGGKVWARHPLLFPEYTEINPADYGVANPAQLLATEGGVSDLLAETADLEEGESIRGGTDNKDVLTEYVGVLTQAQVEEVLGMGTGDFDVRYEVDAKGFLRSVELTGAFYEDEPDVTYTVDLTAYDVKREITAP